MNIDNIDELVDTLGLSVVACVAIVTIPIWILPYLVWRLTRDLHK
jgi:hypothetical protein